MKNSLCKYVIRFVFIVLSLLHIISTKNADNKQFRKNKDENDSALISIKLIKRGDNLDSAVVFSNCLGCPDRSAKTESFVLCIDCN